MQAQRQLFELKRAPVSDDSLVEIAKFRRWFRDTTGAAKATADSECSQLRSLARASESNFGRTLPSLRHKPGVAALVIEASSDGLHQTTVLTRVRAFEHFLQMGVSRYLGNERVALFRANLPSKQSRGWHDAGVSVPGRKDRKRMPAPTPPPEALATIVERGSAKSDLYGVIAALACFSGLELDEIVALRWHDLSCFDEGVDPFWEARVTRKGKQTRCFVLGPGARPLIRHALRAGRARDSSVLPGRTADGFLSKGAARARLSALCCECGWPGLTRSQLVGAFAEWLRRKGFDDHDIRLTLGRRSVATVDNLLRPYNRLDAQRKVDTEVFPVRLD